MRRHIENEPYEQLNNSDWKDAQLQSYGENENTISASDNKEIENAYTQDCIVHRAQLRVHAADFMARHQAVLNLIYRDAPQKHPYKDWQR